MPSQHYYWCYRPLPSSSWVDPPPLVSSQAPEVRRGDDRFVIWAVRMVVDGGSRSPAPALQDWKPAWWRRFGWVLNNPVP